MNTDNGFVINYRDNLAPERIAEVRQLLDGVQDELFNSFIEQVRYPVNAYRAHMRAHTTIPNAKQQTRYLRTLENKLGKLRGLVNQVEELLNNAPAELRRAARRCNSPVNTVQNNLTSMLLALNDVEPTKSKHRPETLDAVKKIHAAFRETLNVEPQIRAYREKSDVPATAATGERFVPVLAALMNLSVDSAYRIAKENLPS